MSNRYAARTDVTSDRSRAEIERTLTRYGATAFSYGWQEGFAAIQFVRNGRRIRFVLPLPDRNDREFTHHSRGPRTPAAAEAAWELVVLDSAVEHGAIRYAPDNQVGWTWEF